MDRSCELAMLAKAKQTSILQFSTMTKFAKAAAITKLPKISSRKAAFSCSFSTYSCTHSPRSSPTPGYLRAPLPHEEPPQARHMKKVIQIET
ncbi:hypothetical protein ACJRO7_009604 [Eucalyptus globulus]|uniref:Uncharacterized protein n=1 Tax=Eucalyptus globulus TaxID=34317 RepID=A0ABD3L9D2_EUCGL